MRLSTPQMIEHYRLALLRVLLVLFKMAGIEPGSDSIETLPRGVKYAILKVLRQAESATRRLVHKEAEGLADVEYVPAPKREKSAAKASGERKVRARRKPLFRLIDPRKFFEELHPNRKARRAARAVKRGGEPQLLFRFRSFDDEPSCEAWSEPLPELTADDPLTATGICRRMQALHYALSDLSAQAHRMKREIAKRKAAKPGPGSVPPLRIGPPPGHRKTHVHEVDSILYECHKIATREDRPPDGVAATG